MYVHINLITQKQHKYTFLKYVMNHYTKRFLNNHLHSILKITIRADREVIFKDFKFQIIFFVCA
jgi:hypothetical protein